MGGGREVQRWEAVEEQRRRGVRAPLEGEVGEIEDPVGLSPLAARGGGEEGGWGSG